MRRLFWVISALLLAACQRDDTLLYQMTALGMVQDGTIVTDEGLSFYIQEQTCEGRIDTMSRVYFTCDVLTQRPAKNAYDIRLTALKAPLTKAPLLQSELEAAAAEAGLATFSKAPYHDAFVAGFGMAIQAGSLPPVKSSGAADALKLPLEDDPIDLTRAWFSGGYLNMIFRIPSDGRETVHRLNLVWNDTAPRDTIRLRFFHDDQRPEPLKDTTSWLQGIVCFQTAPFDPALGSALPVRLQWNPATPVATTGYLKN